MRKTIWLSLLLCLLPALATEALAQRRTDVVTMYNGDRITVEIRSLKAGILECKTDSMGTLAVEWQDIAHIESRYQYEIRTSDGSRYLGSIASPERPGQLRMNNVSGTKEFEWLEVVELRPIEESWKDRLDVYLSGGYSYTQASSVAQATLNTEISYGDENTLNVFTARHTNTDTDEEITSSSRLNVTRSVWTDRSRNFRASWGSYEANDELGLEHRYAAGFGLGRYFIDTHKSHWAGTFGLQLLTEKNSAERGASAPPENQAIEGALTSDFSTWRLDTPELDISWIVHIYPNLSDWGRLRGNTDLRLRWEIIEDLYWDVSAYGTYDNDTGSDSAWDYAVSTGVGWTY